MPAEIVSILPQIGFGAIFLWLLMREQEKRDKLEARFNELLEELLRDKAREGEKP